MMRGGVIAAIVLIVFGAASATPWVVTFRLPRWVDDRPPEAEPPAITLPPQEPGEYNPAVTEALERVVVVLVVLIALAIAGFALHRLIQRLRAAWLPEDQAAPADQLPGDEVATVVDIASLATAVARAEAHLTGQAEPADAVTAAWVALEDEAALQGSSRDPAQTPTEFTTALLEHTPAPAEAVTTLRRLYHKARFTEHPVTVGDVARARQALSRIAETLDAPAFSVPDRTVEPS
jgi:hypothetical protein